jgi:hypothetical protein
MAHAQKSDFFFRRNGRVHLNRRGASVQSTTASRGVHISGSNAGYTMLRGSVKSTGYPLHSPDSPSLPLPCVTVCHHISNAVYCIQYFFNCTLIGLDNNMIALWWSGGRELASHILFGGTEDNRKKSWLPDLRSAHKRTYTNPVQSSPQSQTPPHRLYLNMPSRHFAVPILNLDARRVCGQHHAPASLARKRDPVPILQETGWTLLPVCMCLENLAFAGDSNPGSSSSQWIKISQWFPHPLRAACPTEPIFLDLITRMLFGLYSNLLSLIMWLSTSC